MKKRVKFFSDQSCELSIDAKQVQLKACVVHSALLEEGVYLFTCSRNEQEMTMEYCHMQPSGEDMIKICWADYTMMSTLHPQYNFAKPIDPKVHYKGGAYSLYDVQTGWRKSLRAYDKVDPFRGDGYAEFDISGGPGRGLIDKWGNIFIPPQGDVRFSEMKNGFLIARDTWGYKSKIYNGKGELVLERVGRLGGKALSVSCVCADGLIRWKYCDRYGYVNLDNEEVIPNQYSQLERCGYDLFIASMSSEKQSVTSIIDKNNEPLFPFEHLDIQRFSWNCVGHEYVFIARKSKDAPCRLIDEYNQPILNEEFVDYCNVSGKLWLKIADEWIVYNRYLQEEVRYDAALVKFIQGNPYYEEDGKLTPIK